ncbi:hypothetical protein ANO11243_029850 [Dothideomycetidae sp. 11243]|uniref:2-oxoglutarate-dependent dioxygenase frbA n=1 Tax=Dothideomycetidae sp. (strain 11243) TaxID=1603295 RepID=FRBA_DOTX1|nr:RecName: Full=2-oxoglutarate-dependent dioxygenase frbA; AltName: Full=FR901469 biosynthesis cluster protein A [fungal sp. No.11243]GAM84982.1 hypothetical protein ANO11243_029850 [fungal sp. No.11243]
MSIPSLDYRLFSHGDPAQRQQFCEDLVKTFAGYGFAKLRNHGLSDERVDEAFSYSNKFFNLPLHIKQKAKHPEAPNPHRGYSGVGQEKISAITGFEKGERSEVRAAELRESWDQGPADDELYANRWMPDEDLPGYRSFMESFFVECQTLHQSLLQCIATGLSLPSDELSSRCAKCSAELRLNHYPATPASSLASGACRISPHSDFGTITLLFQDSVGGLQVEDQQNPGVFLPVEPDDVHEMIINVGDCLSRWTDGRLRSVNHRVVSPTRLPGDADVMIPERHSLAYFGKPSRDEVVDSLPLFVPEGCKPKFADRWTALEYNQSKLMRTYNVETAAQG